LLRVRSGARRGHIGDEYFTGTGHHADDIERDDEGAVTDEVYDDDGNPI
jgi:hypothetical protein